MKLKIKTNFSFPKLSTGYKKIQKEFITKSVSNEAEQMKNRITKGITIDGKPMERIKKSTLHVRELNKHSISTPPLNASGKLRKSIKAQKKGVNFIKYGIYHNEGYTVRTNPVLPVQTKAVPKGMKRKKFFFEGKEVPVRKWVHDSDSYKVDKESLDEYKKEISKALKK